jgi:hypothetical protein
MWDHSAHHVQDWDAIVDGYVHRDLEVEDELPANPYINMRPEVPGAVAYLRSGRAGRRLAVNLAWDITRSSRCLGASTSSLGTATLSSLSSLLP